MRNLCFQSQSESKRMYFHGRFLPPLLMNRVLRLQSVVRNKGTHRTSNMLHHSSNCYCITGWRTAVCFEARVLVTCTLKKIVPLLPPDGFRRSGLCAYFNCSPSDGFKMSVVWMCLPRLIDLLTGINICAVELVFGRLKSLICAETSSIIWHHQDVSITPTLLTPP